MAGEYGNEGGGAPQHLEARGRSHEQELRLCWRKLLTRVFSDHTRLRSSLDGPDRG